MNRRFARHRGFAVLGLLSFVSIVLWITNVGLGSLFTSPGVFIASLGKASALFGLTMYCLMPVLAMRWRVVTGLFGGLDKTYRLHSLSGKVAICVILFHPVLLGLGRMLQGRAFSLVWDWTGLVALSGILALVLMAAIGVIAVFSHIRHQRWIWVHRLFGWLIAVFLLHALSARSQIYSYPPLLYYTLFVAAAGFGAFLYRSVIGRYVIRRYRYEVADVNRMTDTVVDITLRPRGVPIIFQAGQFAFLSFQAPGIDPEPHPFSFSNANNGPYVRFTVKALGDDTAVIQKLERGTRALLEGPYGHFSYRRVKNTKQVWIAGGIGITPFLSMARSFSGRKEYDIRFFYGTESLEEAVFLQEFMDITRHVPDSFNTSVVSRKTSGFVNAELIKNSVEDLTQFDYLICGPPPMMKALRTQLLEAGVPEAQIHIEAFAM